MKKIVIFVVSMTLSGVVFASEFEGLKSKSTFKSLSAKTLISADIVIPVAKIRIERASIKEGSLKREEEPMGSYVKSILKISQQLVSNPNGAPKEYVNGIKRNAAILNATYIFLDKCQWTNGEGVEWDAIYIAFDNMQASIEELRHLVKSTMSSPNYNAWHGHEFSKDLQDISEAWDDWEYNLFQIGT